MNIKELRQKRADLKKDSLALVEKAESENRDLNAEEQASYETMKKELASLDQRIKRAEEAMDDERNAAAVITGGRSKDSQPYSIMNVVRAIVHKDWGLAKNERLVHEDLRAAGYANDDMGMLIPMDPDSIHNWDKELNGSDRFKDLRAQLRPSDEALDPDNLRRVLNQLRSNGGIRADQGVWGDDTLGGALHTTVMSPTIIELLRANLVLMAAGAQEITLPPSGAMSWARETQDPTWSYVAENATITSSEAKFGNILLLAKRAAALLKLSNDSIRYTNPAIEQVVRNMLAQSGARFEDKQFIQGVGSSVAPKGIINYAITVHVASTTGTDGNTFEPEDVALMIGKVENADVNNFTAFLMRPLMWAALVNRRADAITAGDKKGPFMFPITRGGAGNVIRKELLGAFVGTTTGVPKDRVKGSGVDLTLILGGDFTRAWIGRAGVMEIAASNQASTAFEKDQTWIRAIMRHDFAITHEAAFVMTDTLLNV